jgi:pimeloyl-ACP methyl ester carboxylesterase
MNPKHTINTSKMGFAQLATLFLSFSSIGVTAGPVPVDESSTLAHNDFDCRSKTHPNPVVLLHGLGATYYEDLNVLESWLKKKDFCTFSITYGAYDGFPLVGGLKPIAESSQQIAAFIADVKEKTGANKVDLVGHSEGAFQTLYTAKFGGVASIVDSITAIAPPTNGTEFLNLVKLGTLLTGNRENFDEVVRAVGCGACADVVTDGAAVKRLNDGSPIAQPGNTITILTSRYDELVTPTTTSFVNEKGVNNIYVQDYCPRDFVGHIGEAYDLNVWNLVLNSLEKQPGRKFVCSIGSSGR